MASTRIIERESEIVAFIEDYISQGQSVKKPLLVQFQQGTCRLEIRYDLILKYGKLMHCIDTVTIKGTRYSMDGKTRTVEGISDHPDVYSNYLLPSGFDPATPPTFLLDSCAGGDSSILTPQFLVEVVQNLRIPCVYFAPTRWVEPNNGQGTSQKPDLSGFDEVWYVPTVTGWLMDMNSDEELPNKKRALRTGYGGLFFKSFKWDDELLGMIVSKSKARGFELVLGFAESIKDRDSFDSLVPGDFLKSAEPTVTLALEGLMSYFTNLLIARQIQIIAPEDVIFDFESKKWWFCGNRYINAVVKEAFPQYLKNSEFDWLFDLSKPVPEDIIKETKQIIEDYKAKYGSVSYRKDEAVKNSSPRAILEQMWKKNSGK